MMELLIQEDYELNNFIPFADYIRELEALNLEVVSSKKEYDWQEIICKNGTETIRILVFTDSKKEWITIYKSKREGYNYEKVEFILYKDSLDRFIKYAAHFDDETYSKIVISTFSYEDNVCLDGWTEKRKIDIADLEKIETSHMNLSELIMRAELKYLDFYEAISLKGEEVKELKLDY